MPLTEPKRVVSPQFASYLFYYHRQRNTSLGMGTDNQFMLYLMSVARQAAADEQLFVSARKAFFSSQIVHFRRTIKDLLVEAETSSLDRQREILVSVTNMHDEAKLCLTNLKKLEN